jgi:hypothetical protein
MLTLLLLSAFLARPVDPGTQQDVSAARARFQALHEKVDKEGCAALWKEKPALALPTIEADLDEALAKKTAAKDPDPAGARGLEGRALWGARIASEALAAPLIADLAATRVGWSERDLGYHRDELAVHEKARSWLEKAEYKRAQQMAHEAANRAIALGDWHEAATAFETSAIGSQGLSEFDDALVAWMQARILYRGLELRDREIACLRGALDVCFTLERVWRGRELADQAVACARAQGDRAAQAEFLLRRAGFEEKLGLTVQAEASRLEAQNLSK